MWAGYRNLIPRWRMWGLSMANLGIPVVFLFRDDFITAEAAPLTSPRTAEPGPGIGVIVDTGNNLDIVAEEMISSGIVGEGDPGYALNSSIARSAGLNAYGLISIDSRLRFGWNNVQSGAGGYNDSAVRFQGGNIRTQDDGVGPDIESFTTGVNYELAIPLRSAGAFYLIRGQAFSEWTLIWVGIADTTSPIFAGWMLSSGAPNIATLETLRISQLPAPWDTDDGIATSTLDGARSAGDTFTHEADCLIEFEVTTVPAALQIEIRFRIQDATNFWQVTVDSTGRLDLDEVVAGGVTNRGTAAAVIANGDRVVIIAEGTTIRVFEANVLRITYAAAANFQTETDGELETEGTGGSVSDIKAWPRIISSDALTALNRVADA